jgi:nitric oxide reductase activation protein
MASTVETKVYGHTGDVKDTNTEMYELWRTGDPHERLGLIDTIEHIQNYDGYAIDWCAKEILSRGDEDEQRVILVLSDGLPEGTGYHGITAQKHVRDVVDWAEKKGVQVIQIAIDSGMDSTRQAVMFKEYIPFKDFNTLPQQLGKLLAKLT